MVIGSSWHKFLSVFYLHLCKVNSNSTHTIYDYDTNSRTFGMVKAEVLTDRTNFYQTFWSGKIKILPDQIIKLDKLYLYTKMNAAVLPASFDFFLIAFSGITPSIKCNITRQVVLFSVSRWQHYAWIGGAISIVQVKRLSDRESVFRILRMCSHASQNYIRYVPSGKSGSF